MFFHVTLSQGRADTFYLESKNKNSVLSFLNSVSTSIVRNLKEIVFSKRFHTNYTLINDDSSLSYYKVVIVAYSESFAKTFILYNVKRSITQEILEKEYKKLFINDEKIIGFYDIQFYNEVSNTDTIDNLFQVQYSKDSKTYVADFYSDNWRNVKDFFTTVMCGELLEIRKYVYQDTTIKKDDGDYIKRVSVYISNDDSKVSFSLPKVKSNLTHKDLNTLIKTKLVFKNSVIKDENIVFTYR